MFQEGRLESEQIVEKVHKKYFYLAVKRLFDIIVSGIALLLLWPLFIIISIIIRIDSKGPAFLKQARIGKDGEPIKIYKFRSMVDNAEALLDKLMAEDSAIYEEYTTHKKLQNDPRITKVGKFIRKTSIDELPQLINIFKGDMSLVGPRPYLYREIKDMGSHYNDIIQMTPGLTGPWQVSGRNDIGFEERCKIDSKYLETRGIKEDTRILFKTFSTIIKINGK